MTNLLNSNIPQASKEYLALCTGDRNKPLREITEKLWARYSPYADPDFPAQFSVQVHARFWEMYLAVQLLDKEFDLVPKTQRNGPDIQIKMGDTTLWIEAIAPGEGTGIDAVPAVEEKQTFEPVPEEKIILRYTHAISEKMSKQSSYILDGTIEANDPFVIAVNGRAIQMTMFEGSMPNIIKAVYPVGEYQVTISRETLEKVSEGYQVRHEIHKESGAPVATNLFLDPISSTVSGVLYSDAALWDYPISPGSELLYIHNSVASVPLPKGWLREAKECKKSGNSIVLNRT